MARAALRMLLPTLRRARLTVALAICGAAALLPAAACLPGAPGAPSQERASPSAASPRIGKAVRGNLTGVLTFVAEVQAKGRVAIVPRVSARLDRLAVGVGARVRAGDTLAELDHADLDAQLLQAQAAQAGAEAKLAQLKSGPRPEAVAAAQANLKAAQARVQALESASGPSADPNALQQRVDEARAKLDRAQAPAQPSPQAVAQAEEAANAAREQLNRLLEDPARKNDRAAVDAAREQVRKAEAAVAGAKQPTPPSPPAVEQARRELQEAQQAQLQTLLTVRLAPSAFDLDQARALVEVADAQAKLAGAPASPDEIKAAEAAAEQAFALTELARARLGDATLTAPIDGVVTELSATPGSTVGPTGAIMALIPPELQATVRADESQAAQLQVGQTVQLSVESLPRDAFAGVVKAVAPVLDPRTRTVAVEIEIGDPQGKLRPGMFAQLAVQTGQRDGALLVPKDAVLRLPATEPILSPQSIVFLVVNNRVHRQRVALGASDAHNVEVLQGLSEGADLVLNPRPDLVEGEQLSGG